MSHTTTKLKYYRLIKQQFVLIIKFFLIIKKSMFTSLNFFFLFSIHYVFFKKKLIQMQSKFCKIKKVVYFRRPTKATLSNILILNLNYTLLQPVLLPFARICLYVCSIVHTVQSVHSSEFKTFLFHSVE